MKTFEAYLNDDCGNEDYELLDFTNAPDETEIMVDLLNEGFKSVDGVHTLHGSMVKASKNLKQEKRQMGTRKFKGWIRGKAKRLKKQDKRLRLIQKTLNKDEYIPSEEQIEFNTEALCLVLAKVVSGQLPNILLAPSWLKSKLIPIH